MWTIYSEDGFYWVAFNAREARDRHGNLVAVSRSGIMHIGRAGALFPWPWNLYTGGAGFVTEVV